MKRPLLKLLFEMALFALIAAHPEARASYREACTVRYETESGWSTGYQVQCIYITGAELNSATTTFKYQVFDTYAVVFWKQNEASVIRLKGLFVCGMEASNQCASMTYMPITGTDQQGRTWKVCAPTLLAC